MARDKDQVHVIVHQAPGEAAGPARLGGCRHQPEILAPIIVREEHRQAPIAALGHMMGCIGDHDTGEARHERRLPRTGLAVN